MNGVHVERILVQGRHSSCHVISFAQSNTGCAFPLFQCVCSNADPVEGGLFGGKQQKKGMCV